MLLSWTCCPLSALAVKTRFVAVIGAGTLNTPPAIFIVSVEALMPVVLIVLTDTFASCVICESASVPSVNVYAPVVLEKCSVLIVLVTPPRSTVPPPGEVVKTALSPLAGGVFMDTVGLSVPPQPIAGRVSPRPVRRLSHAGNRQRHRHAPSHRRPSIENSPSWTQAHHLL